MTGPRPETPAERRRRAALALLLRRRVTDGQRAVAASVFSNDFGPNPGVEPEPLTGTFARKVRVGVGNAAPRLSERIAPNDPGVLGTLGDAAEGVENFVRGVPQGLGEGALALTDAAVTAAGRAGEGMALLQTDPGLALRLRQAVEAFRMKRIRPAMEQTAEAFGGEGAAGAVGRMAGALIPAGGAAVGTTRAAAAGLDAMGAGMGGKMLSTLAEGSLPARAGLNVAVNAPLDVAYGLTDPNQSGGVADDIALNLALSAGGSGLIEGLRTPGVNRRLAEVANSRNLDDLDRVGRATADMDAADRLARTRAEYEARRAADEAAAQRQGQVDQYLDANPTTEGADVGNRYAAQSPIVTPPPVKPRGLLGPGTADVRPDITPAPPAPTPPPLKPAALASEAGPTPTITPTVVKGKTRWVGGATKFSTMSDDQLIDRFNELEARLGKSSDEFNKGSHFWTRYDDDIAEQRSGTVITSRGGRAIAATNRDARLIDEVQAELVGRGWRDGDVLAEAEGRRALQDERLAMAGDYHPGVGVDDFNFGLNDPTLAGLVAAQQEARGGTSVLRDRSGRIGPVYHGSPHRFDKFSMEKIGTGEGAQAYGHGLYFADKYGVAKDYRKRLSGRRREISIDGGDPQSLESAIGTKPGVRSRDSVNDGHPDLSQDERILLKAILDYGDVERVGIVGALEQAETYYAGRLAQFDGEGGPPGAPKGFYDIRGQLWREHLAAAKSLRRRITEVESRGAIYHAEIDADDDELLHWDKPLAEQPQKVREALAKIGIHHDPELVAEAKRQREAAFGRWYAAKDTPKAKQLRAEFNQALTDETRLSALEKMTGADIYRDYYNESASQATATRAMRDAGIKGIKYLNGVSRAKGEGGYNYVVFDDALVNILNREGRLGASGEIGTQMMGSIAGAGIGATVGAAQADDGEKVGGALTGAIAGAVAGSMLVRALVRQRQPLNKSQLAFVDPDVKATLSEGAPRPSLRQQASGLTDVVARTARRGFQSLLDDVYAARRFGKVVGKSNAVSEEVSRSRGWRGFADVLVGTHGPVVGHPSLRAALEAAKGVEADVTALLRAERAIELADNGKGWYLSVDRATAERTIAKLDAVPSVRAAADELRGFYDYLLKLRHESGLLDDAQFQAIKAGHQKYVPFVPDTDVERVSGTPGGKLFNRSKGVRKLTEGAGGYAKVDPFLQAALDASATARDVSRQRVMQAVAAIVEAHPAESAPFIREIPANTPSTKTEGRTIDAIVDGARKRYEVLDEDLWDALGSVSPGQRSILVRTFGYFSNALRTGVTIMPSFGAANATRDGFFTARAFPLPVKQAAAGAAAGAALGAATSDDKLEGAAIGAGLGLGAGIMGTHALRIARGLSDVLGNTELYQSWMREGGAGFGFYGSSRRDYAKLIRRMQRGTRPSDIVNPVSWWDAINRLNEAIEQAPRVAKFKADIAAGASPRSAAVGSREVSVDFSRGGADPVVRGARATSAFWNPNLQGKLKLAEVFKDPKAWAIGMASMTVPSIALWHINKDDPEYWRRPLWERNLAWLVPIGTEADGRTRFLKIPKPFEVGYVFGSLPERLLDYAYQRDSEKTKAALADMAGSAASDLLPVPTAVEPLAEVSLGDRGFDTFRQRPIVTSDVDDLPSRYQYNNDTRSPAIAASRLIGQATLGLVEPSPQKVEHVVRGWTGTLGSRALAAGDRIGKKLGLDKRPESIKDEPTQWARFVTRPNDFGTDDVQAMFRRFDRAERVYQKAKDLDDQGDEAALDRYVADHADELKAYYDLKDQVAEFRTTTKVRRKLETDPSLTPERRKLALQRLGQIAAGIAAGTSSDSAAVARR